MGKTGQEHERTSQGQDRPGIQQDMAGQYRDITGIWQGRDMTANDRTRARQDRVVTYITGLWQDRDLTESGYERTDTCQGRAGTRQDCRQGRLVYTKGSRLWEKCTISCDPVPWKHLNKLNKRWQVHDWTVDRTGTRQDIRKTDRDMTEIWQNKDLSGQWSDRTWMGQG